MNIEKYIHECYDGKGIKGRNPKTTFIAYGADLTLSKLADDDEKLVNWYKEKGLTKKDYYKSVKNDLNSGRIVLFSGTGCQNNGLKKYLGKDYENLYCIDVVCHGVPSPKLWRHYLEHIETINNAKIIGVNFRCKDQGWKNFGMEEIQHDKKKVYIPSSQDSFMRMFLRNYCLRPSCYECEAKLVRCADLTLADFWGINFVAPEMNDNKLFLW